MLNLSTPDHFRINIGYALEQAMLNLLLTGTLYNIEQNNNYEAGGRQLLLPTHLNESNYLANR